MLNLEKLEKLLEIGDYADIRINFGENNSIPLKDGKIEEISSGFGNGVAVRVLYKNGWGFVTSNIVNEEEIEKLINKAYKMAKISNEYSEKEIILKDHKAITDNYKMIGKIKTVSQMGAFGFLTMNWYGGEFLLWLAVILTIYSGFDYIKEYLKSN